MLQNSFLNTLKLNSQELNDYQQLSPDFFSGVSDVFLAAIVTANPYDESGYSTAFLKRLDGGAWSFSADESWANIQGVRSLPCTLVVDFSLNEVEDNDMRDQLKGSGMSILLTDWFFDDQGGGECRVDGRVSFVAKNDAMIAEFMKSTLVARSRTSSQGE